MTRCKLMQIVMTIDQRLQSQHCKRMNDVSLGPLLGSEMLVHFLCACLLDSPETKNTNILNKYLYLPIS